VSRFLASLLLALFSLPLISPALLVAAESKLPACCRRAGIHGCSLTGQQSAPSGPAFNATRCASFPGVPAVPVTAKLAGLVKTSYAIFACIVPHPSALAQTDALYRISYSRTSQKRGPPAPLV
jgi:hypothetical protein